MGSRLRDRLTYANVMATIAVFIAIGGTSVATTIQLTRDSVGSGHVRDGALTHKDVRDGTLTSEDLRQNTIRGEDIGKDAVQRYNLADGSVGPEKLSGDLRDGVLSDGFRGSPAGGDLTGTYPHPTLRDGAVGLGKISQSLVDPAAGEPGLRTLGTGAGQAAAGNDPRLSDARPPTGTAGGDLTGTYPSPGLAASSVGSGEIADGGLRLSDLAVFVGAFNSSPSPIPAHSCALFQVSLAGTFDVQSGDVVEVYPSMDDPANSLFAVWSSGVQDDDGFVDIPVCNPTAGIVTAGGFVRYMILRP